MCSRAVDLIPSLMERIEKLEEEKVGLIEWNKRYMKIIFILGLLVVGLIISHMY